MNIRILAALAAACIATPAMARAREPYGPACDLPPAVMRQIPPDATAARFDGDEAASMLRRTRRPTSAPRRS